MNFPKDIPIAKIIEIVMQVIEALKKAHASPPLSTLTPPSSLTPLVPATSRPPTPPSRSSTPTTTLSKGALSATVFVTDDDDENKTEFEDGDVDV